MKKSSAVFISHVILAMNIFILSLFSTNIYATPPATLPIFNNFWYVDAQDTNSTDVCQPFQDIYHYDNKFTTQADVEKYIVSNLPSHSDCSWQSLSYNVESWIVPKDFPGDFDDFTNLANSGAPITTGWITFCAGKQIYQASGTFYPSYICKKGSIRYCDPKAGCKCYAYKDYSCLGDVVGRDMISKWPIIAALGHLGVTVTIGGTGKDEEENLSSYVAEVLRKPPPVIEMTPLTNFKNISPRYWGAKYSLPNYPVITPAQVTSMLNLTFEQYRFDPTYTIGWNWYPGGFYLKYLYDQKQRAYIQTYVFLHGQFRCDSFVYYLYKDGANLIIPYAFIMTPQTIYNAFLFLRDEQPLLQKKSFASNADSASLILINSDDDLEAQIKQLFLQDNLDINQADQLTYQYINIATIPRDEKIRFLFGLTQTYITDDTKFSYLINILSVLKPTEMADALISLYKSVKNIEEKSYLLELMNYSIYYDSLQEVQALTPTQQNGIIAFENFLHQQLWIEKNVNLYQWLFLTNLNLLDRNTIYSLFQENETYNLLGNDVKIMAKVWLALMKPIDDINSILATDEHLDLYSATVCMMSIMLPNDYFSDQQKSVINNYLIANRNLLTTQEAKVQGCDYDLALSRMKIMN